MPPEPDRQELELVDVQLDPDAGSALNIVGSKESEIVAIAVETRVLRASGEQADTLDASIEAAMMQRGGPPPGLMVHFQCPHGDGFRMCNVWRTEAEMDAFYCDVMRPNLAAADLDAGESEVVPVWGFARP